MKILKRWWVWYGVCLLVISIVLAVYISGKNDSIKVDQNNLSIDKECLYGIEDKGNGMYSVYLADSEGHMMDSMTWDSLASYQTDIYIRSASYVPGWEEGDLFALMDIDEYGNTSSYKLYQWNHEEKKMDYLLDIVDYCQANEVLTGASADHDTIGFYTISRLSGTKAHYQFSHLEKDGDTYKSVLDGMNEFEIDAIDGYYSDKFGWIVLNEDGDFERYQSRQISKLFQNDGSVIGKNNVLVSIEQDYIIFRNIETSQDVYIPIDHPENMKLMKKAEILPVEGKKFEDYQFFLCRRNPDGSIYSAYLNDQADEMVCYFAEGDSARIVREILYPAQKRLLDGCKTFILFMGMGMFLLVFVWFWLSAYHARMSLYLKILLIMVCLISGVSRVMFDQNYKRIATDITNYEIQNQYRDAINFVSQMDLSIMKRMAEGDQTLTDEEIQGLFQKREVLSPRNIYDMEKRQLSLFSLHLQFYPVYYLYRDKTCYTMSSSGAVGAPVKYTYNIMRTEAVERAVKEKTMVSMTFSESVSNISSLIFPIADEDSKVIGAIEVMQPQEEIDRQILNETTELRHYQIISYVILLSVLIVILYIFLRPIKKLTVMAEQLGSGQLDSRMPIHGNDEISEISSVFNKMADGITSHMGELQRYTDAYSKFLPDEIFQAMGKDNVTEISMGDEANIQAATMVTGTTLYEKMISRQKGQILFDFINDALMIQLPLVKKYGGVVDIFENAGIRSYFAGNPEAALKAAIDVICKLGRVHLELGGVEASFQALIGYGMIHVGVVGSKDRKAIMNLSEEGNLSVYLRKKAEDYGADILVLEEAAKQIPLFGVNYRVRTLGYVRVTSSMSLRLIYEVFDTNKAKMRSAKEQTLEIYEEGVRLFFEGKAVEARNCFVQVLRVNKLDKASQKYFYLCDQYMNENLTDYDRWIEEY